MRSPLIVAVCGFGSIGRRHAVNATALGARVVVWSRRSERIARECRKLGVLVSSDLMEAMEQADGVVVATPTDEHISIATRAARQRKAMYIEKPLSHSRARVAQLALACTGLAVEIGCQLRAHPALRMLKARLERGNDGKVLTFHGCVGQRLDQWRPGTDYRASYSADRVRGGGALFDLVHEVDLATWLCGPVTGVSAKLSKVSDLEMNAEDLANVILECRGGACGSLQLDMLSPMYRRAFSVVCERSVYLWDYVAGTLIRRTSRGQHTVYCSPKAFVRNDLFIAHMRHFLRRIREPGIAPLCSLADGISCLDVLVAATNSSRRGRWLSLPEKYS